MSQAIGNQVNTWRTLRLKDTLFLDIAVIDRLFRFGRRAHFAPFPLGRATRVRSESIGCSAIDLRCGLRRTVLGRCRLLPPSRVTPLRQFARPRAGAVRLGWMFCAVFHRLRLRASGGKFWLWSHRVRTELASGCWLRSRGGLNIRQGHHSEERVQKRQRDGNKDGLQRVGGAANSARWVLQLKRAQRSRCCEVDSVRRERKEEETMGMHA